MPAGLATSLCNNARVQAISNDFGHWTSTIALISGFKPSMKRIVKYMGSFFLGIGVKLIDEFRELGDIGSHSGFLVDIEQLTE
jgi:hypothetical protein